MKPTRLTTNSAHTESALFKIRREQAHFPVVARLTIDGEPVSKSRARFTKRGSKTHAYTPENVKVAEHRIAWSFRAAAPGHQPLADQTFGVTALFFNGTRQRRDVDNMVKLILDGLNGVAWKDDSQVVEISARKMYTPIKDEARTEVLVYWIGPESAPTRPCARCEKPFRTYASWERNPAGRKYCSPECREAAKADKRDEARRAAGARDVRCEACGESFSTLARTPPRFCSQKCRASGSYVEIACKVCAMQFRQYRSWAEKRPYCSRECVMEMARRRARERRTKTFPGRCAICGAGTTRKEYRRCNPCKLASKKVQA